MPKVSLGKPDYERMFGAKLKAAIIGSGKECQQAAEVLGIDKRTLSNRFREPANMTLGQMRLLIRMTDLSPETVMGYLYGRKRGSVD